MSAPYPGAMTSPTPDSTVPAADSSDDAALALAHAMFDACREGRADAVLPYIDAGAPATMRDQQGNSLLMLAAYHGHADLVAELACRGADVDQVNDRGQSPLAGAVFKGDAAVARALLAAGADPDAGTPSARESVAFFGREEIGEILNEEGPAVPRQG